MPAVEVIETYGCAPSRLFALLRRPAVLVSLAPPSFGLTLLDGPDEMEADSRYTVQARRWGLSRKIVTRVVECVHASTLIEEQESGPLKAWRLERLFRQTDAGTELTERVTFEPPGGMLGLTLTAARVEADVRSGYAWRRERLVALVAG